MNEFSEDKTLEILGARENNLKNIDLSIPRNALVVITGISGLGNSVITPEILRDNYPNSYADVVVN